MAVPAPNVGVGSSRSSGGSGRRIGIDGVILGGTELPLLLRTPVIAEVPALDTTALHVDAIVRRLRGGPD